MPQNIDFIAVDCGNTSVKVGLFRASKIQQLFRYYQEELTEVKKLSEQYKNVPVALVSVVDSTLTAQILEFFSSAIHITSSSILPFQMSYETPFSLGVDRVCNAAALSAKSFKGLKVAIDIGTCIKYDVLNEKNSYLGGAISPGIDLRYKSLNDYTAKLPLLSERANVPLIGSNTKFCIQSGVMNGVKAEIIQMISKFEEEYKDLTFFVTGGDANSFDFEGKNNIFVDENLTLEGLQIIYSLNA